MKRDLWLLTGAALAIRTAVALVIPDPPWTDSAYYFVSAQRLADGSGLSVPFIWSFLETGGALPANPTLPVPSHAHWMPLTAMVTASAMELLGMSWRAAQVPMVLVSTLLTPLAYLMAMRVWGVRSAAIGAALLVVLAGPLLLFGSIVENFAVFGVAGSLALFAAMRSVAEPTRRRRWLLASGGLVGVATLARVDGLLLAVAPATAWLIGQRWTGWHPVGPRPGWLAGISAFALFVVAVLPWAVRNLATFGSILPSTGGHTLWIKTYNEQFSLTADTSLAAYLAQGPWPIVASRLEAWLLIGGYTLGLLGGVFGLFFLGGLWASRRRPDIAPFAVYFVVMLVLMGGIFTFHAPRGLFYHHAAAWLPIAAPLAVVGIGPAATLASRWWSFLARPATHRFLLSAALAAAVAVSGISSAAFLAEWHANLRAVHAAARFLAGAAAPNEVVLYRDAPLLAVVSGHPVVAPPFDPYPVVGRVAAAYEARWFVAQLQATGPAIEPLGLWEGGDAVDEHGNRATWLAAEPAFEDGTVRIYEVTGP